MNGELAPIANTQKPFYCSIVPKNMEEKKQLFNALDSCDKKLNDCVDEVFEVKDIYFEEYTQLDETTNELVTKHRTILFGSDGTSYVATAKGIFNSVMRIMQAFGEPSTWETPIKVQVVKRPLGGGKFALTLKLV